MSYNIRSHFPIFHNNPDLVYLDSASSTQKPQYVIDATNEYISKNYANIGRWWYSIAEASDELYFATKQKTAKLIGSAANEIIFAPNATYAINTFALALLQSDYFQAGDEIILSIAEHHANMLVRENIAVRHCLTIQRIGLNKDLTVNMDELQSKISPQTKLVALTLCSNVLGVRNELKNIRRIIGSEALLLVDWSQAVPNYQIDVKQLDCDALVFSTHKFLAYTWLGILYMKKSLINKLTPWLFGGGIVEDVTTTSFHLRPETEKFEPGTPNIVSIASWYYAMDYWTSIGWYDTWNTHEKRLMDHMSDRLWDMSDKLLLVNDNSDIGIFSFVTTQINQSQSLVQQLNEHRICVRSWWHCAYPLAQYLGIQQGSIRVSLYIYNSTQDIDAFVDCIRSIV